MPTTTAAPVAEAGDLPAPPTHTAAAVPPAPPRPRRRSRVLAVAAVLAALFVAAASTEENEPARVDESSDEATGDPRPEVFSVGDLVELGDWQVRVHGVTDPVESTNQFAAPAPGNRWVAVDTEVTNTGAEAQTVSSLICFELVDEQNRSYTMAITAEGGSAPPDGEVAPGTSRRGAMTYEVPADAGGLRLTFKCDLFSTGSATIALG